jgi:hypothetical protein
MGESIMPTVRIDVNESGTYVIRDMKPNRHSIGVTKKPVKTKTIKKTSKTNKNIKPIDPTYIPQDAFDYLEVPRAT